MAKKKTVETETGQTNGVADGLSVGTYMRGDDEVQFVYRTDMPIGLKIAFIDSVVDVVVGDGYYYPLLKDMIFDFQLVNVMTDIEVDIDADMTNAQQLDAIEKFLDECNIAEVMRSNIDIELLVELLDGVDKLIEYKTGIHPSPITDGIASILGVAEAKLREFDMNSVNDMVSVLSKLNGDVTPEKMLEAYVNSDTFKRMADDVADTKRNRSKEFDDAMSKANKNATLSVVE